MSVNNWGGGLGTCNLPTGIGVNLGFGLIDALRVDNPCCFEELSLYLPLNSCELKPKGFLGHCKSLLKKSMNLKLFPMCQFALLQKGKP